MSKKSCPWCKNALARTYIGLLDVYCSQLCLSQAENSDFNNIQAIAKEKYMKEATRDYNVGGSDYSKHKIQPWDIWLEYGLNPWDADIVKRVLRDKEGESRKLDYEKIIHICKERIRQIDNQGEDNVFI